MTWFCPIVEVKAEVKAEMKAETEAEKAKSESESTALNVRSITGRAGEGGLEEKRRRKSGKMRWRNRRSLASWLEQELRGPIDSKQLLWNIHTFGTHVSHRCTVVWNKQE